jgi:predicted dienelactone hydrolase
VALDAAYSLGGHDPRVKAIVPLAPDACFFSGAMLASRSVPMMLIAGTDDRYNPPAVNAVRAYGLATASPRWLAMLTGGTHLYFTDFSVPDAVVTPDQPGDPIVVAFAADEGSDGACNVGPVSTVPDPELDFAQQHSLTIQLALAFLDRWMYGDGAALQRLTAAHEPALVLESAGN